MIPFFLWWLVEWIMKQSDFFDFEERLAGLSGLGK